MLKRFIFGASLLVFGAASISGCVVRETRGGGCRGGYWVEGHRGPHGHWHERRWSCPGEVTRVEID